MTLLAPDLAEAILRDDEPNGISLQKLWRDLPVRWGEQRGCMGRSDDSMWAGG